MNTAAFDSMYAAFGGKLPMRKELAAEYDGPKKVKADDQAALDELKPRLADLKRIRHNYVILERDDAPNDHHSLHHRNEVR